MVCRVATILQTRYTAPGFWLAGLRLFEDAERLVTESSQKEHLKMCIARAHEHLQDEENRPEVPVSNARRGIPSSNFLLAFRFATYLLFVLDHFKKEKKGKGRNTLYLICDKLEGLVRLIDACSFSYGWLTPYQ